ncbi:hypothetical protein C0J52_07730 [Blattella germanica]|nr:hypothetical protein C0J52_07730 [Blattella germanica]
MVVHICSPTTCEVLSVIRFLNAQNIAPIEIRQVYGPEIMSKQMLCRWCRLFFPRSSKCP